MAERVPVAVVEATRLGSEALANVLRNDGCNVVFAGTAAEFTALAGAAVLFLSATLDGVPDKGYEVARRLRRERRDLSIVILVDKTDPQSVVQAFRSGASGIFGRDGAPELLGKCVTRVAEGQVWASSEELQHVLDALTGPPRLSVVNSLGSEILARREQEVVHCVAEGFTNREIAERLNLSENTVKNYLFRIFEKLGISSRVELIMYATSQYATRLPHSPPESLDARAFREAAESLACPYYTLASFYEQGRGTAPDPARALAWYLVAGQLADEYRKKSAERRSQLERQLTEGEVAKAKQTAAEWQARRKHQGNEKNGERPPRSEAAGSAA